MATDLPDIIKKLEELVLASSGVEPFEEILKLIYAKLYSERKGELLFSAENIDFLFDRAKKEWPGMFDAKDTIELSPAHLKICVRELGKSDLHQTDLAIIDTAFEYLLPKSAKGSRGQYFTPRHIIAEMVKIINPKKGEYILDPACGSGGFLLHAADFINNSCYAKYASGKPEREHPESCNGFWTSQKHNNCASINNKKATSRIYGVDFDKRMVKIAKVLMLIAGFEDARIYEHNSLTNIEELNDNTFDVVFANPPFGGEIRDEEILKNYELEKNDRHILFIEKIIRFLRPGGRGAIVVPQGILNNTNLACVREWLFTKARILGVIGLDGNTFKPHTNVKTSLLFIQKWDKNRLDDYPVFMAVSQKSGKDKSGKLVDNDLDKITRKLREFIKKEKLGF